MAAAKNTPVRCSTSDLIDGMIGEAAYTVTENAGGIDAGTYDVKLTLTDPVNYKWETEEGGKADTVVTFTITPKSIAGAEVATWRYSARRWKRADADRRRE